MFVNWNTWVTLKIGNIDRWTVSWIRLEMWRWGNWISCRKELDFIKPQRREHAILILMYKITKMTKSGKSLKSGEVSEMAVNWVRFPWCSAGPTSGDVISSNISRNHSTVESPPFSTMLYIIVQLPARPNFFAIFNCTWMSRSPKQRPVPTSQIRSFFTPSQFSNSNGQ